MPILRFGRFWWAASAHFWKSVITPPYQPSYLLKPTRSALLQMRFTALLGLLTEPSGLTPLMLLASVVRRLGSSVCASEFSAPRIELGSGEVASSFDRLQNM